MTAGSCCAHACRSWSLLLLEVSRWRKQPRNRRRSSLPSSSFLTCQRAGQQGAAASGGCPTSVVGREALPLWRVQAEQLQLHVERVVQLGLGCVQPVLLFQFRPVSMPLRSLPLQGSAVAITSLLPMQPCGHHTEA